MKELFENKTVTMRIIIYLLLSLVFTNFLNAQIPDSIWLGTWKGHLEVQGSRLRVQFHLKQDSGAWKALMDSPDQMQFGLEMDEVEIDGNRIKLVMKAAHAKYEGSLNSEKALINGKWIQGAMSLPLGLVKDYNFQPRKFPQTPKAPFPYKSEEITYRNEKADIQLGGTITIPQLKEGQKAPVLLLITGSGAQDRDETIAGHKPFWVIADHFSRRGFAVLRVDDRGVGASGGNPQSATTADFVTDVQAGINYLQAHPDIDPKRIILMGHSEGGLIAMMVAAKSRRSIAGIISLAGPGLPMSELMTQQIADLAKKEGLGEAYIQASIDYSSKLYELVKADRKNKLNVNTLLEKMKPYYDGLSQDIKDSLQLTEQRLMQSCATVTNPWFRYFIKINPAPYLKKITCPVLALNGGADIQVAAGPNLEAIAKGIRKNGNKEVTCTEIQGLNHLFQSCQSCTIQEYAELEETFSPAVLKAIEGWLMKRYKAE